MAFMRVGAAEDIWEGEKVGVVVKGRKVLLLRLHDRLYAYEDRCAHLAVPLSSGRFENGVLICAAHEWQYDPRTGVGINPKGVCLKAFPVEIRDGSIFVDTGGGRS